MSHTPAPWTIQEYGDDECPTLVLHRGETESRICFMATPGSHGDPAMIEGDARLIAAAPDLLEALCAVRLYAETLEKHLDPERDPAAAKIRAHCGMMRAAIAKATGSQARTG